MIDDLISRINEAAADAVATQKGIDYAEGRSGHQLDADTYAFTGKYGETIGFSFVPGVNIALLGIVEKGAWTPPTCVRCGPRFDRLLTRFS